uniref:Uncharacterized protein n=1 Tax=viral metagenome TaxID=1070528 RepID=A0A6C0LWP4_9ZZZZ
MTTDTSLIAFKAITGFVTNLSEVFGDEHRNIMLYSHLLSKTTLSHEVAIQKHFDMFRDFCVSNRDVIEQKNFKNLTNTRIEYSDNVWFDFKTIFEDSDTDTRNVIWKHVLIISAITDPAGQAKQIIRKSVDKQGGGEANFLTDIVNKIEENVDPNANPMEAITSIMSSGVFTDLISGMGAGVEDGSLDMSKLMGTVQTMMAGMGGGGSGEGMPDMSEMMKMLSPPAPPPPSPDNLD